jgi:hypothetical protein
MNKKKDCKDCDPCQDQTIKTGAHNFPECDEPNPCPHFVDSRCVIYTGEDIVDENEEVVVSTGDSVSTIITTLATRSSQSSLEQTIVGKIAHNTITNEVSVVIAKNQTEATFTAVYDNIDGHYILTSDLPILLAGQTFLTTSDQRISRFSDTQIFIQVIGTTESIIESTFVINLFPSL